MHLLVRVCFFVQSELSRGGPREVGVAPRVLGDDEVHQPSGGQQVAHHRVGEAQSIGPHASDELVGRVHVQREDRPYDGGKHAVAEQVPRLRVHGDGHGDHLVGRGDAELQSVQCQRRQHVQGAGGEKGRTDALFCGGL